MYPNLNRHLPVHVAELAEAIEAGGSDRKKHLGGIFERVNGYVFDDLTAAGLGITYVPGAHGHATSGHNLTNDHGSFTNYDAYSGASTEGARLAVSCRSSLARSFNKEELHAEVSAQISKVRSGYAPHVLMTAAGYFTETTILHAMDSLQESSSVTLLVLPLVRNAADRVQRGERSWANLVDEQMVGKLLGIIDRWDMEQVLGTHADPDSLDAVIAHILQRAS